MLLFLLGKTAWFIQESDPDSEAKYLNMNYDGRERGGGKKVGGACVSWGELFNWKEGSFYECMKQSKVNETLWLEEGGRQGVQESRNHR